MHPKKRPALRQPSMQDAPNLKELANAGACRGELVLQDCRTVDAFLNVRTRIEQTGKRQRVREL